MRKFLVYVSLEFKRSGKVTLGSLGSLLVVLCLAGAGVAAVSYMFFQSRVFDRIRVAVVVPEEEREARLIAGFLSTEDSIEAVCDFVYLDEKKALSGLEKGEVQAAIVLPEHFYNDVYTGQSARVRVYFPESPSFNVNVFHELLNSGVSMIRTTEAGAFAATDTEKLYGLEMSSYDIAEAISRAYIECAFRRGDMFVSQMDSPFGSMDLAQYYFSAFVILFLVMSGLIYSFLYKRDNLPAERKLCMMGLNPAVQSAAKVFVMACLLWCLGLAVCLAGYIVSESLHLYFLHFDWSVVLGLFPLTLGAAAYFHFVYSFAANGMQGSVTLLCVNGLMLLGSGVLLPAAYMPEWIGRAGAILPIRFFHRYCADLLFDDISLRQAGILLIWTVGLMGTGVFISWKNILYGTSCS